MLLFLSLIFGIFNAALAGVNWTWRHPRNNYEKTGIFLGTAPSCDAHSSDCAEHNYKFWYEVTEGDGKYCSSGGRKVYCNANDSPYSNIIWRGTASYCTANKKDCDKHKQTIVAYDGSGDGKSCSCTAGVGGCTNKKVMCVDYHNGMDNDNITTTLPTIVRKRIESGFYIGLMNDYSNISDFVCNDIETLILDSVTVALNKLIKENETDRKLGKVANVQRVSKNANIGIEFQPVFENSRIVCAINLRFDYNDELNAISAAKYLQDETNTEKLNEAIENELKDSHITVYFVEANRII